MSWFGPSHALMFEHMGGGPVGGMPRMLNTEPLPPIRQFHDVDTTPYRIPDRLPNPVRSWVYDPPVTRDLSIIPKPEPLWKPFLLALREDPDPQFTLTGVIRSKPVHTWQRKDPELAMLDYLTSGYLADIGKR